MEGRNITDKTVDEFLDTLEPNAKNWRFVEFRCMIQDILGNEIYSKHNSDKLGDRTIFYCITIPGENEWVRKCNKNEFMTPEGQSRSDEEQPLSSDAQENSQSNSSGGRESEKEKNDRISFSLVNWSFPIPSDGKNRSCLIKVYDIRLVELLRVNDIVQVGGLVEPSEFEDDSELHTNKSPSPGNGENNNNTLGDVVVGTVNDFEPANDFPHRLVPRIHVRTLRKLVHTNPLLPEIVTREALDVTRIKLARARLSTILTQLLGGDSLTADYLIMSLISRIRRRKDVTILGQFTVGISGIKPEMSFLVSKLGELISKITTHSHSIDMSIANLNNLRFTPKKDLDNNKMIAGTLQLPDGLYLMLNETALTEGQLTSQGTDNVKTLNHIIRWQRHNYNFNFHSVEIDTDLKILVISDGKSILNVPYHIPIEKNDTETISSIKYACESIDDFLTEDLLNMFRYYITALGDVPDYTIPDDVQKQIQEDFVNWRKNDSMMGTGTIFSADDLSSYMTLARYLTISRGETSLTPEIWKETCKMESTRNERLSQRHFPTNSIINS